MLAGSIMDARRGPLDSLPRQAGPFELRLRRFVSAACGAVCLCFLTSTSARAASLQGRVLDESTLVPLVSATVRIQLDTGTASPVTLITDSVGHFGHARLPGGLYRVTLSFIGYSTVVLDSLSLAQDHTDTLNVELVPRSIDMELVVVTASRHPETYENAPSAMVVVDASELQRTAALSHADHLERLPAVDASSTGLNTANVVVRGFNNVLSTTLLSLSDYRIIQIPSLRVNAYQFSTTVDDDIERMELVLGPASALYGPNTSSGVMHLITRSPFSSTGGRITVSGGERNVAQASLRWAGSDHRLLGFRVAGQYFRGTDWATHDSEEPDSVTLFREGPEGPVYDAAPIDNQRDFEVENYSADVRGDLLLGRHGSFTLNSGFSQASNIELTDFGAAQIRDWRFGYVQARTSYRKFFVQGYINFSDGGDSYLRRSGSRIIDRSRLYVAQFQHTYDPWAFLKLTYGLDAHFTRPETEGTLHGRNEQRDDISSLGGFVQSEVRISSRLQALAAARLDHDNVLDDPVPSPRVAAIYHAGEDQSLRLAYNRAFGTPSTADLFLDVLTGTYATPDTALIPYLGATLMEFRGAGSVDGFHFSRGADSRPQMVSLYGDLLVASGAATSADAYLPPDVNSTWPGMRLLLVGQAPALDAILPDSLGAQVPAVFARVNESGRFEPVNVASIQDVHPLRETATSTLEAGYKGRIGKRFAVSADVYYTEKSDFVGPLQNETPHALIDSAAFVNVLRDDIFQRTGDSVLSDSVARAVVDQLEELPIGLVSPVESQSARDVLYTRRNFGTIDLVGLDLSATMHLNSRWDVTGTYSFISENLFRQLDGISDVATNAPRHKCSGMLQYQNRSRTLSGQLNLRWVDGFPVRSGVYVGEVERYMEVGFNLSYQLWSRTQVLLSVQNVLDQRHAEFVGSPELGRLAVLRVSQQL